MSYAVSFYQLMHSPLEKVLPKLLEKVYDAGKRAVVVARSEESLKQLNTVLWTYSTLSFIPHGCIHDCEDTKADQPIWLSTEIENPNSATLCVATHEQAIQDPKAFGFDRILDIYDHTIDSGQKRFNDRLAFYKNKGATLSLWQQTKEGWRPVSLDEDDQRLLKAS
jgi:DNA polymerase-3 subunit chi